jgi:signal peptidase I
MPEGMRRNLLSKSIFVILVCAGVLLGALVLLSVGLRISGALGGPGYELFSIPAKSMAPALRVGDRMFALTNVYGGRAPPRGDVVVFTPSKPFKLPKVDTYVKRVIGLPGDRVQYRAGRLILNGQIVERTPLTPEETRQINFTSDGYEVSLYWETLPDGARYVIAEMNDDERFDNTDEVVVPAGQLFMLGDHRDSSADSRMFGAVSFDVVRAKPIFLYWSSDQSRIGAGIQPGGQQ